MVSAPQADGTQTVESGVPQTLESGVRFRQQDSLVYMQQLESNAAGDVPTVDPRRSNASGKTAGSEESQQRTAMRRLSSGPSLAECLAVVDEMGGEKVIWTDTMLFSGLVALEVLANLVVLGLEVDNRCRQKCSDSEDSIWRILDHIFTGLALLDVGLTIWNVGIRKYFRGDQYAGMVIDVNRCLDFTFVMLRVLDVWILFSIGGIKTGLKFATALRFIHLAKFANKINQIPGFRELWWIMHGLGDAMRSVITVMTLLLGLVWLFAIIITLITGKKRISSGEFDFSRAQWGKDDYWGTMPATMFSLFQLITRDRWSSELTRPLIEFDQNMAWIFLIFMIIGNMAALSTIVGVIVESTLSSAKINHEQRVKDQEKLENTVMRSLEGLFQEADTDNTGLITRAALKSTMKKPHAKARMELLGIRNSDMDLLFTLLDQDGAGEIKTSMFFRGCMRLRGPAMSRDTHSMKIDISRNCKWLDKNQDNMEEMTDTLHSLLESLWSIDTDVIRDDGNDRQDPVFLARRQRVRRKLKEAEDAGETNANIYGDMLQLQPDRSAIRTPSKSILATALKYRKNIMEKAADKEERFDPSKPPPPPPVPKHLALQNSKSASILDGDASAALAPPPTRNALALLGGKRPETGSSDSF